MQKPVFPRTRPAAPLRTLVALAFSIVATAAWADTYPSRTITLVTGAPPGGGADAVARALAESLQSRLRQTVVVDNRPGAGGMLSAQYVSKAPADGYTLLMIVSGYAVTPAIMKKMPYDPDRDFTSIGRIANVTSVLAAGSNAGARDFKELRELARRNPDALTFASSDTSIAIDSQVIASALGAPINVVNYKGTAPALIDLAGGHVSFAVTSLASILPYLPNQKVTPIAVIGPRRSALLPDVPTFGELGVKGLETGPWHGMLAPAETPKPVVELLNREVNEALRDPKLVEHFRALAIEPAGGSAPEFDRFVHAEIDRMSTAAPKAGILPQ